MCSDGPDVYVAQASRAYVDKAIDIQRTLHIYEGAPKIVDVVTEVSLIGRDDRLKQECM
jgi:hypothetical protein